MKRTLFVLTLALVSLNQSSTTSANEELRSTMTRIATAVTQIVKRQGAESVAVGEITGPASFGSSAGVGMKNLLIEELQKQGIRHKAVGAPIGIKGEFRPKKPEGADHVTLDINVSITDQLGEVLSDLNSKIQMGDDAFYFTEPPVVDRGKIDFKGISTDTGVIAEILGANVDLKNASDREQSGFSGKDVIDSFNNPTAFVAADGSVRSHRNSPYSVKILVDGVVRPVKLQDGQPFVELEKGEVFQIGVSSRVNFATAATFTLDGMNSFCVSDIRFRSGPKSGTPRYSRWIVQPNTDFLLKGWHKTNEKVTSFELTDASDSVAARLGTTGGMGMISVKFQATWPIGSEPPADEPAAPMGAMPEVGIGEGGEQVQIVKEDRETRQYGMTRSVVTIRYIK